MSELERKKRLLAAQSDVYREMLRLEIHNVRLSVLKTKRNVTSIRMLPPLLMGLTSLLAKKTFGWKQVGSLALLGWQLYRQFGFLLKGRAKPQDREPTAAEEFLSRRI